MSDVYLARRYLTCRYLTCRYLTRREVLAGLAAAGLAAAGLAGAVAGCGSGGPAESPGRRDLRGKIASLLVVGFRGQQVHDGDWIMRAVRSGLGGIILFDKEVKTNAVRNISSPQQVTELVQTLRAASPGRLIVSIDQEGGSVARLNPSNGFPATESPAAIGARNSPAVTRAWADEIAGSLKSIGANLNYAPVVDLNLNPRNPAIGQLQRSFSADVNVTVENAAEEIDAHRALGVRTSIKHFPGLGTATANTDFDVADLTDTWTREELEPFRRLIQDGQADSVLVGHFINRNLDPDRPASLSPRVVTDLLRGDLGWTGPVVSDDMQAVAITQRYGRDEATTLALQAGVDLLVFGNQQVYDENVFDETVDHIAQLVRSGQITEERIDESVARVDSIRPA